MARKGKKSRLFMSTKRKKSNLLKNKKLYLERRMARYHNTKNVEDIDVKPNINEDLINKEVNVSQEDIFIKNEPFDEDDDTNMAYGNICDVRTLIKTEVGDEDDGYGVEQTNMAFKIEIDDEDHDNNINMADDMFIKTEPVDDGDFIHFGDGDGNVVVKEEPVIKEEIVSDEEDIEREVNDISLKKRRQRPKKQSNRSNLPPLGIIQDLHTQSPEDQNKLDSKTHIEETNINTPALNTNPGNTYTVAVALMKHFICDICDRPFNLKSNLARHIHNHPQLYTCSFCSYKTKQKHHLNRHMNSIHTKNIFYNCTYCNYSAFQKHQLNQHINAKHTKTTTYTCSHCNFTTYRKGDLSQHVNSIHVKAVFHTCSYCNYKSHRTGNLTRHVNALHTKQKSYSCAYCAFKTYDKSTFNKHVQDKHRAYFNETFCDLISYYNKEEDEFVKLDPAGNKH